MALLYEARGGARDARKATDAAAAQHAGAGRGAQPELLAHAPGHEYAGRLRSYQVEPRYEGGASINVWQQLRTMAPMYWTGRL